MKKYYMESAQWIRKPSPNVLVPHHRSHGGSSRVQRNNIWGKREGALRGALGRWIVFVNFKWNAGVDTAISVADSIGKKALFAFLSDKLE